ncbi:hypothetical protein [Cloacibacillus evryensis]|uniref:hypothetical protein n=1 Tax=Cloacibacillus evryensis TaxID=508460 RepID=UPI0026726CBF|nr:hypothetical protein [Cloacibacillus evryensis]
MKANCPKCKKPFSIKEHICPNCGYTLTNFQYKFRIFSWRFFCCCMTLCAIVLLIVFFATDSTEKTNSSAQTSSTQESVAQKVPVADEKTLDFTPTTFVNSFNKAGDVIHSDLKARPPILREGEVYNTFHADITKNLGITGAVEKKSKKVKSITMIGTGDGTAKSGADIIIAMLQVIATVSPELKPEKRTQLLNDIGLLKEGGTEDGKSGTYTIGDLQYFYNASELVGFWFGVEPVPTEK